MTNTLEELGYKTKITILDPTGTVDFIIAGEGEGNRAVHLGTGVKGIYDTPMNVLVTEHAFQNGGSYGGTRYPPRRFSFGVVIYGEGGHAWDRRDSAWRRIWFTDKDCTMIVETPHSKRTLKVRLAEAPEIVTDTDPNQEQVQRVVMSVIALDPFWYSDEEVIRWENPTSTIGVVPEHVALQPLMFENSGDFYSWPIYELEASAGSRWILPDYSWGNKRWRSAVQHANRHLVLPEQIANEFVRVDTDEMAKLGQFRTSLDTPFQMRMNGERFLYPLPAGLIPDGPNVTVGVANAPAGLKMTIRLRRPWTRPFGMEVEAW